MQLISIRQTLSTTTFNNLCHVTTDATGPTITPARYAVRGYSWRQSVETQLYIVKYIQYIYKRHIQVQGEKQEEKTKETTKGLKIRSTGAVSICNVCYWALQRLPPLGSPCQILQLSQLEDPAEAAAAAAETRRLVDPAAIHFVRICRFAAVLEQEWLKSQFQVKVDN